MAANLWVIGSGKGGVGKTFLTSNLGVTLSKMDKRVLLVDLDFSGANLHTSLGEPHSDVNLYQYWVGGQPLSAVIRSTAIPRVSYIQGHWDQWSPLALDLENSHRLIEDLRKSNFDYVLVDLGPGASEFHLDLFHQSDERFLVTTPEPTSIEKTYRFVESMVTWTLRESATPEAFNKLVKALTQYRASHKVGSFSFRQYLNQAVGFDFNYFEQIDQKPIRLIVNESRSQQDRELGHSIQSVCKKFYDLPLKYTGALDHDNAVWQSVRGRSPVLMDKPFTPLAGQMLAMCKELTQPNYGSQFLKAVV